MHQLKCHFNIILLSITELIQAPSSTRCTTRKNEAKKRCPSCDKTSYVQT